MSTFTTQDIAFGLSGQAAVFDCEDGRPTSITSVTVYRGDVPDTGEAEAATTGSAAVETNPSTTITATAGAGESYPDRLTLTAATGVALGRTYRLTDDDTGVYEDVTVRSANGTAIVLTRPLRNTYTSASTFVSCRSSISISSTWAADLSNLSAGDDPNPAYRAVWIYVLGGVTSKAVRYLDLVRYPARHGVTPVDMDERFPGWLDSLPPDNQADQGRALIDRAFRSFRMALYKHRIADQAMRNAEAVAELVMSRAMLLKVDDDGLRGADVAERRALAKQVYDEKFSELVSSSVVAVDTGSGGDAKPVEYRPWLVR